MYSPAIPATPRIKLSDSPLSPGARVLIAVSGGADSVALLHRMRQAPYQLIVGHIDHGLRPSARQDARFVASLARRWDLPCVMERVNVKRRQQKHAESLEEAARVLRYRALARLARRHRCQAVVTAHTADDQAETVLMNFLRGSGPAGLAGIPPVRDMDGKEPSLLLWRPLLQVTRAHLRAYGQAVGLSFREDPSNRDVRFFRNRIRRQTLPQLERLMPGLRERLLAQADIFRCEEDFWRQILRREMGKTTRKNAHSTVVDLRQLFGYHKSLERRILRLLFPQLSFNDVARIEAWAAQPTAKPFRVAGQRWVRRGSQLILRSGQKKQRTS